MSHPIINIVKTEWGYLGKRKRLFLLYVSLFVIAGIIDLATPYILGTIFNSIQQSITSKEELSGLAKNIMLLLLVTVVFWIFHGFARVLETSTGFHVKKNYVNDKIRILLKLPVKWHKDNHSGDTIDKINRASGALEDFSSHMTFQIIYGIISFLGSLIILIIIDWKIGAFAFVFSMITLFIISRVDKRLNKKYQELNVYSNKTSAAIFDYLSNIITLITLRLKKTVSEEINAKQAAGYPTFKSSSITNELKWGFASVTIKVMVVAILIYRAYSEFDLTGTILVGTLYMVYGYLDNVGNTFYKFAELYGEIIRSNARLVGADPIDNEYKKLECPKPKNLPKKWKEIIFRNVSFKYDRDGKLNHINNINFSLKRKQKIAFVGESGSGKSTVLSLIRGLYNIDNGEILCDNVPLKGKINEIKENITLIPQDPEIFNNTLKYNITMNLPAKEQEIEKAIKMSQLKPVLERLPLKLETNVMEKGVSLSGGEKQRLALARGLFAARKSDIILMDEPTSSVDSLNETKIHDQIFKEFKDKTIVSSIHRLHLLDKFDYIYLFSKGKIVAQGTFEELKDNPNFEAMWSKYNKKKGTTTNPVKE
ncbi:MAG: ABC transporter ATP-binding protein/permease [Nanoarchaeota archaeon]|nr:ABC transporter ATP-binding protein/permease [Nanoarchaeota archaeon]